MKLYFKTLTHKNATCDFPPEEKIKDAFKAAVSYLGLVVDEPFTEYCRFVGKGKQFVINDETLAEQGLTDGDIITVVLRMRGGKPVILLYPPVTLEAEVSLSLSPVWSLSEIHPPTPSDEQSVSWKVTASPGGSLRHKGKKYHYLFWEALTRLREERSPFLASQNRVCLCTRKSATGDCEVSDYLYSALKKRGLKSRERQDMITYWLPELRLKPYVLISFLEGELYEQLAPLRVTPQPDLVIRVFMLFRPVDNPCEPPATIDPSGGNETPTPKRRKDQFTVVEWGGMKLD